MEDWSSLGPGDLLQALTLRMFFRKLTSVEASQLLETPNSKCGTLCKRQKEASVQHPGRHGTDVGVAQFRTLLESNSVSYDQDHAGRLLQ